MTPGGAARRRATTRPTLADVARAAGVSVAAVSYVLNGRGGVSPATAETVRGAADRLGFRPNRLAQGLRGGVSRVLGLVLPTIVNPFYPEIADGIITAAAAHGYHVFLSQTGADPLVMAREVATLCDHQVGGLVFTAVTEADRPLLKDLLERRVPFVQVVRCLPRLAADAVTADNAAASREIARHILGLGHREIAVIAGPPESSASAARLKGVRRALAEAGRRLRPRDLRFAELSRESGREAATELLRGGCRFTALICGNDMVAIGAADALLDHGLAIPDDVALVGFDDMSFASSRLVDLTTVHQPLIEFGSQAVELLMTRIADPGLPPRTVVLPHRIVLRRSSGGMRHDPLPATTASEGVLADA